MRKRNAKQTVRWRLDRGPKAQRGSTFQLQEAEPGSCRSEKRSTRPRSQPSKPNNLHCTKRRLSKCGECAEKITAQSTKYSLTPTAEPPALRHTPMPEPEVLGNTAPAARKSETLQGRMKLWRGRLIIWVWPEKGVCRPEIGVCRCPPSVANLCRGPSVTNPCRGHLCRVVQSSIGLSQEGCVTRPPRFCYMPDVSGPLPYKSYSLYNWLTWIPHRSLAGALI